MGDPTPPPHRPIGDVADGLVAGDAAQTSGGRPGKQTGVSLGGRTVNKVGAIAAAAVVGVAVIGGGIYLGTNNGSTSPQVGSPSLISVQTSSTPAAAVPLPMFKAVLAAPSTIFTVEFPGGAPSGETYTWTGAISCGTFVPFSKTPTVPVSGGPEAKWTHPNAPLPPPDLSKSDLDGNGIPDYCPHSEVESFSHPGTITVMMSDGRGGDSYCTYQGSLTGIGQCSLGKPR